MQIKEQIYADVLLQSGLTLSGEAITCDVIVWARDILHVILIQTGVYGLGTIDFHLIMETTKI